MLYSIDRPREKAKHVLIGTGCAVPVLGVALGGLSWRPSSTLSMIGLWVQ